MKSEISTGYIDIKLGNMGWHAWVATSEIRLLV